MGSFIDEKNIINNNIQNYNNFVNDKGKFIEGSPTFTTYYSKDNKASTNDIGLGATVEIVGAESPIKYNRLEGFPLYNFDELQLQYEYDDEMGIDTDLDGTAIIVPGTIKPLVDDLFRVSYLNKNFLFRINNVEGSSIGSKFFYKIEYSYSASNVDILEERQLEERYDVLYDNIGTKNNSIIKTSISKYIEQIDNKIDDLRKIYINYFYDKKMNLFILNGEIYDNYLHEFISKNNLFIKQKTFLENILIKPVFEVDSLYYNTLYEIIEHKDKNIIEDMLIDLKTIPITKDRFNIFSVQYKSYLENCWVESKSKDTSILYELYKTLTSDNASSWELEIFSINFMEDSEDKIQIILQLLNNRILNNINMYLFVPCYIYILLKLKNNILNK